EPDAGNPHVRFDERRRETASWCGLRHRCSAKAAGPATPHACHDRARLRLYTDEQRREAGCIAGRMPPYLWKSALSVTVPVSCETISAASTPHTPVVTTSS